MTLVNNEENMEGLVKEAIYSAEKSNFFLKESVVSGFSKLILLDKKIEDVDFNLNKIMFKDVLVNNCKAFVESENSIFNNKVNDFYSNSTYNIKINSIQNKLLQFDRKAVPV